METHEPMPIRRMFPDVKPDRVEQLLLNSDFQARHGLSTLLITLDLKKKAGLDVADLSKALVTAYSPAMEALRLKLIAEGWDSAELSAAYMVAQGTMKIR